MERLAVHHKFLSKQIHRSAGLFIGLALTLAGCDFKKTNGQLVGRVQTERSLGITGKIDTSSLTSLSACQPTSIQLIEIGATGEETIVQSQAVGSDNTYRFNGVSMSTSDDQIKYVVRALGCREAVQRIVTGRSEQNITVVTSLIAFATRTENFNKANTSLKSIQAIYQSLTGSSSLQVYNELTTNPERLAQFQSALSVAPIELETAAPVVVKPPSVQTLQEGVAATITVDTYHWSSSFIDAIDWILDGQTVSHQKSFSWTPQANDQGSRTLIARVGKDNGSGQVDSALRFKTISYPLQVENTILPSVPALSLLSSSPTLQVNVTLQLATGTSQENCASFSSLKFVVDTPLAPLLSEDFPINCSDSPNQSEVLTLTPGDGVRRIYLWAKDSSGLVSASPQWVDVVIDTVAPTPTVVTNQNYAANFVGASGVCETGRDVVLTGDFSESPLTISCLTGVYSQTLTPVGADGSKGITVTQTDAVGLVGSQSTNFIRDTAPPVLSLAAPLSSAVVSANVTVSGTCVIESSQPTTVEIIVGTFVDSTTCVSGSFSKLVNLVTLADGSHSVFARQTDYAGNVGLSSSVTVVKDTVAPQLVYSAASAYKGGVSHALNIFVTELNPSATQSLSVSLDTGSGYTVVGQTSLTASVHSNQLVVVNSAFPSVNMSAAKIKISLIDAAGNAREVTIDPITIDSIIPVVANFIFNSGLTSATQSNLGFNLSATDNFSMVASICLKKTSTPPTAGDDCWAPVSAYGQVSSNSVAVTSFYNVGLSSGSFTVYAFAKDQAGWVSELSASGAGTAGVDRSENTLFTAPQPPKIEAFEVTSTDVPSQPFTTSDVTAAAGNFIYLRWKITSSVGFPGSPIELRYSVDEINFDAVLASSLSNSNNGSCTIPTGYTGCARLASPLSSFYRLRIKAVDLLGFVSLTPANPLNTGTFKVLSGNTDLGLGGSALSAVLRPVGQSALAVLNDGRIFILDERGLMMVSPQTGILERVIPDTDNVVGDNVPVSAAQLRNVSHLLVDKDQNLILFDENFIRRVNTNSNPMTIHNVLGGGSNATNTVMPASELLYGWGNQVFTLPNGDILFRMNEEKKMRWYKHSDQTIHTILHSGVGNSFSVSQNTTQCPMESFFPITNSAGELSEVVVRSESTKNYLTGDPGDCGYGNTGEWKAYSRHLATNGIVQLPAPVTINTNSESQGLASGYREVYRYYGSLRGDIYAAQSGNGVLNRIAKYNKETHSWDIVLGNGTPGSCADLTPATQCAISAHSVSINSQGQIFYLDDFAKAVRTLDASQRVVTVVGDKLGSDDGTPANLVRYNLLTDIGIHDDGGQKIITLLDFYDSRIRQFTAGGNILTVAGNQRCADADIAQAASTQPIYTCADGNPRKLFVEANGDLYFTGQSSRLMRLNRATNFWDTPLSSQLYGGPNILAARPNEFLLAWIDLEPGRISYKAYNRTTKVSTQILGKHEPGASTRQSATYCADGTAPMSCNPGSAENNQTRGQFDSVIGKYVMAEQDATGRIVLISPDGSSGIQTLATMPHAVRGFHLDRSVSPARILYCGADWMLHSYNLSTLVQTDLPLPVPGYGCTGPMVYDSTTGVLTFVMSQNGLNAIGELTGLN